jgi:hypothetical protein
VFILRPSVSLRTIVLLTGINALTVRVEEITFAFQIHRTVATRSRRDHRANTRCAHR